MLRPIEFYNFCHNSPLSELGVIEVWWWQLITWRVVTKVVEFYVVLALLIKKVFSTLNFILFYLIIEIGDWWDLYPIVQALGISQTSIEIQESREWGSHISLPIYVRNIPKEQSKLPLFWPLTQFGTLKLAIENLSILFLQKDIRNTPCLKNYRKGRLHFQDKIKCQVSFQEANLYRNIFF